MSLTTITRGRGRRVAAGSLIAVAALALSACQNGTDSASHSSSASAPATAGSQAGGHDAQSPGSGSHPSGQNHSNEAAGPSSGIEVKGLPHRC